MLAQRATPGGRMVLTVFAGIAEFERALIAARTEEVVLQLSKNGKRATGWIDQTQSHAATSNSWLMN